MFDLYVITQTKLLVIFDPHLVHCESNMFAFTFGHSRRNNLILQFVIHFEKYKCSDIDYLYCVPCTLICTVY